MPFKPGQSGNPGGRPVSTLKTGSDQRVFLSDILLKNRERFIKEFNNLQEKEFLKAYLELTQFITPKPRREGLTDDITLSEFLALPPERMLQIIEEYKQQNITNHELERTIFAEDSHNAAGA
jgi:hypothetical protein